MCEHQFSPLALESQAWCVRCGALQVDGEMFSPGEGQALPPKPDAPAAVPSCGDPLCRGWRIKTLASQLGPHDDGSVVACSCHRAQSDEEAREWFEAYVARHGESEPNRSTDPCDPGCRGWFLDAENGRIERCDECAHFEDDIRAVEHVAAWLRTCQEKDGPVSVNACICESCGGENVEHAHWVQVNALEVREPFGTWCHGGNSYCNDCGENTDLRDIDPELWKESAA